MTTIYDANGRPIDPNNQTVYSMGGSTTPTVDRGTTLNSGPSFDPVGPGPDWSSLLGLVGDPIYSGASSSGGSTMAMNNPNTSTRLPAETGMNLNYDGGFSPTQVASMGDPAGATQMGYAGESSSPRTSALQGILRWLGGGMGGAAPANSDPWSGLRLGMPASSSPGLATGTRAGPTVPGLSLGSGIPPTLSPQVHAQLMAQQVLQNPTAAAAIAQGSNHYVNPTTNMMMPTTDINGNIRNTYADAQDIW